MTVGQFFKRVLVPVRQRPVSEDLNRLQNQILEAVRGLGSAGFATSFYPLTSASAGNRSIVNNPHGFVGPSFLVTPNPAATPFGLLVYPGIGLNKNSPAAATSIDSTNGTDYDANSWAPLCLSTFESGLTVPAPPLAGNSRIDIIEVRSDYLATDPQTVGIFNTATTVFDPATRNKTLDWDLLGRTGSVISPALSTAAISYKKGVNAVGAISAATPPAVTTGYTKIAQINLDGAVAAVTQEMIVDFRRPILPSGILHVAGRATIPGVAAGIGLENFPSMEVPPGVTIKMAYQNNVAPSAGTSYTARFYVVGAITPLSNAVFGSLIATPMEAAPRCVYVAANVTSMGTSDIAILDGTNANWTVVNGTQVFPYGQPCAVLDVTLMHPAGSALTNDEEFCFQYTLSMA
jgi:hypothetical protein